MQNQLEVTCRQKGDTLRMLGLALQGTGQLYDAAQMLDQSVQEQRAIPEEERTDEDVVKLTTTCNELRVLERHL